MPYPSRHLVDVFPRDSEGTVGQRAKNLGEYTDDGVANEERIIKSLSLVTEDRGNSGNKFVHVESIERRNLKTTYYGSSSTTPKKCSKDKWKKEE